MQFPRFSRALAVLSFSAALSSLAHAAPLAELQPGYHLAATYKLPGAGGWDYLNVDSAAHRLYIARGTRIQVVDTQTGALVGEVGGVTGAHGVALNPKLRRGFATSGRDGKVVAFDLKTLAAVGTPIAVGDRPDAIVFEPVTGELFAMNAGSNNVSIIDAAGEKVIATVALEGNPEFAVADGQGNIFVNVESSSQIAKIDARTLKLVATYPLAPGEEPTGLAYDAKDGLLFSGCANNLVVAMDAKTGAIVTSLPIGAGVDAVGFDPEARLAFTSNGQDGTISVIGTGANHEPWILAPVPSHRGARTLALDPVTHALWLVAAEYEAPAPVDPAVTTAPNARPRRPRMIPGSAMVMKFDLGVAK